MVAIGKCPKCRHSRRPDEVGDPERCPACGLYFRKWAFRDQLDAARRTAAPPAPPAPEHDGWRGALRARLDSLPGRGEPARVLGRALMWVLFLAWSVALARVDYRDGDQAFSFMHAIVLVIHEAGHVLFMPFGQFMTVLGGSLFQVLLPLIVAATLLWQNRDPFGAALGLWWCGAALLDLAPYIYDAADPKLMLLGGHTGADGPHDWIYLLGVLRRVPQSPCYGSLAHTLGVLVMALALAWAGRVLWRTWQVRHDG